MRTVHEVQTGHHGCQGHGSIFKALVNKISKQSERIWFCITFFLFIILGPFSVIAVLYGLWALGTGKNRERMVEPIRC